MILISYMKTLNIDILFIKIQKKINKEYITFLNKLIYFLKS